MSKTRNKPTNENNTQNTTNEDLAKDLKIPKPRIQFRTESQEQLWKLMDENEIIFFSGLAGTGKSYMAVLKAIELYRTDERYSQIVITTPAVEADEKLGALPGDVMEKLSPYTFSTIYLFEKILGKRKVEKLLERGVIRVIAFAYMRGINIDNSIVIVEEAQNTTIRQMKTLLTRIGEDSKYFISGDLEQSDRYKDGASTGLYKMHQLKDIDGIGVFQFKDTDIVRNPLITKILEKFD